MPPGQLGAGRTFSGTGWLGRIAAALATCAMLVLAVMFSVVLLAVAAVAVITAFGWFWWRSRHMRRQMQGQGRTGFDNPHHDGTSHQAGSVIEGEVLKGEWKEDRNPPP